MGNPHAIVYMDDIDHLDIEKIGPAFENHVAFPDRVNTEFVEVIDEHTVKMRVWAVSYTHLDVYKRQVDDQGYFIGIITRKEIIKYCYKELKKYIKASDS